MVLVIQLTFKKLDIHPTATSQGVFVWYYEGSKSYLVFATEDILFASTHKKAFDRLLVE